MINSGLAGEQSGSSPVGEEGITDSHDSGTVLYLPCLFFIYSLSWLNIVKAPYLPASETIIYFIHRIIYYLWEK